ncbi:hypothetical protein [Acidithiobacillus sp.]|uniref:hypothetical protein n=1 Tax=Acidithiobacillus sp. TaxID=1872118 RepID=UPI002323B7E4|nr:hypothetical protein [Acidithiobacillus sp.]MDA8245937.1 hypothetical protein [Acidithiobacillus sp.]
MINLPYGGGSQFDEKDLILHIRTSGRDYIITGGCNCVLKDHTKPHSLDFWLRSKTRNNGVRQTCQELIDDLVATGLFVKEHGLMCPDSRRPCSGVRLA